ncbi:hypothetical protein GCM10028798_32110 [Humibacter antri]
MLSGAMRWRKVTWFRCSGLPRVVHLSFARTLTEATGRYGILPDTDPCGLDARTHGLNSVAAGLGGGLQTASVGGNAIPGVALGRRGTTEGVGCRRQTTRATIRRCSGPVVHRSSKNPGSDFAAEFR